METFDLDIIDAVLINFNTCVREDKFFTGFLSFCFDLKKLVQNCLIILIFIRRNSTTKLTVSHSAAG